jgi:hypothetical protein
MDEGKEDKEENGRRERPRRCSRPRQRTEMDDHQTRGSRVLAGDANYGMEGRSVGVCRRDEWKFPDKERTREPKPWWRQGR